MSYSQDNDHEPVQFQDASGFYTTRKRSALMSKIRGKDTKPELLLRKALWQLGFRYRLNVRKLPGTPDIVFRKQRIAIFVDGEFWHGYNWEERKQKIKTNRAFWLPKIEKNMERDRLNTAKLEAAGWTVLRFWAADVQKNLRKCLDEIMFHLGYRPE